MRHLSHFVSLAALSALIGLAPACSSKNSIVASDGGAAATGPLTNAEWCSQCTFSPNANPSTCKTPRAVNACCTCVAAPVGQIARGTGLHYFSSTDPTVDLSCLAAPKALGATKTVTLSGHVKLFSSGGDSQGVKIEVFTEGPQGALGSLVGTAVVTTNDDTKNPPLLPLPTWSSKCPADGCKLRSFTYEGVPTETPLIVKTSDANASASQWSELYDYDVYIPNPADGGSAATYDPSAVAATDVNTVASAAGGRTIRPDKGVLAGEVHDCGDVRLSGAFVDTDVPHEADMFYFGENESDPLPDTSRTTGTSRLGLFGALNIQTGVPIHISAVGVHDNASVLLGTYTVQTFPGAVTALSLRGRRPWQK